MNEYTASNGVSIRRESTGLTWIHPRTPGARISATVQEFDALREFFRAEEDERLGRWRWPENPEYVVYHARNVNGDRKVLNETDGHGTLWGRDMNPAPRSSDMVECAARAYFDAHPEPKPWHDAQEGEVWVFTTDEGEFPAFIESRIGPYGPTLTFDSSTTEYELSDTSITAGRRIYPEVTE